MASQLVGLENIPNVYITKINLEDNNTQTFSTDIFLQIDDRKENGQYIWSSEETFFNFLRVGLIKTSDSNLVSALTNGIQSPYPSELVKSSFYNSNTTLEVFSIREFFETPNEFGKEYHKKSSSLINLQETDLTVFAFCYLDTVGLGNLFEIELSGELKQYFGALTSEKILKNNAVVSLTNIFLNPNSTVWTGPVHYNPGMGYMAGSFHSPKPHGVLKQLTVQNIKLSDNRTKIFQNRLSTSTPTNAIISDLHYSLNKNADLLGLFSINCKQFVLTKTKLGRKMFNANPKLFNEFLNTIQLNSISVIRQQVKTLKVNNKLFSPKVGTQSFTSYKYLTTTLDASPNQLVNTDQMQQIYLNSDFMIRNYQFQDTEMTTRDRGQFRYEVEITIVDKSQDFIRAKINNLNLRLNDLETTVEFLNRPSKFDYKLKKLKNGVSVPPSILETLRLYYETLSYFKQIEVEEIESLISSRLSLLLTGTYQPLHGERFLKDYQNLITNFQRKYKVYNKYATTRKPKKIGSSFIPNLISISKPFSPIISFDKYRRSYDCLGIEGNATFAQMTKQQYLNRGEEELERFFDTSKSIISDDLDSLDSEVSTALTDLTVSKNSFLTPLKFHFDKQTLNINLSKTDATQLNKVFVKSVVAAQAVTPPFRNSFKKSRSRRTNRVTRRSNRQRRRSARRRRRNRFSITSNRRRFIQTHLKGMDATVNSDEFVGKESAFTNVEPNLEEPAILPETAVLNDILATSMIPTSRNKFAYDITAPNSVLDSYITSKSFNVSKLKNAPLAFKALACSRSDAAKNNVLSSDSDILVDPEYKVLSQVVFQTSQRVEMMIGYARDMNNEPMLSTPIWQPIDVSLIKESDTAVCRLVYEELAELGLETTEEFKLPVQNDIFIISSRDVTRPSVAPMVTDPTASNINVDTKNELSRNIKYATSNIIIQSSDKDSIEKNISKKRAVAKRASSPPITRGGY